MYETYTLVRNHGNHPSLSSPFMPTPWKSPEEVLEGLSRMKKRELLELFLRCDAPSVDDHLVFSGDDDGEEGGSWRYDGYLLDNGPILVRIV